MGREEQRLKESISSNFLLTGFCAERKLIEVISYLFVVRCLQGKGAFQEKEDLGKKVYASQYFVQDPFVRRTARSPRSRRWLCPSPLLIYCHLDVYVTTVICSIQLSTVWQIMQCAQMLLGEDGGVV